MSEARWGGDEFVVSVWDSGEEEPSAQRVLERVAEELRENPAVLPDGEGVFLTFSGGVCRWKAGDVAAEALAKADEALYQAKGGNTVVHAD